MIKYIGPKKNPFAIIIDSSKPIKNNSIEFISPTDFPMQIGLMNRPESYMIAPHKHNEIARNISITQEVLFLISGVIELTIYDEKNDVVEISILNGGYVVLLARGGHGIKVIKESNIIEIKQGPYLGPLDKTALVL